MVPSTVSVTVFCAATGASVRIEIPKAIRYRPMCFAPSESLVERRRREEFYSKPRCVRITIERRIIHHKIQVSKRSRSQRGRISKAERPPLAETGRRELAGHQRTGACHSGTLEPDGVNPVICGALTVDRHSGRHKAPGSLAGTCIAMRYTY